MDIILVTLPISCLGWMDKTGNNTQVLLVCNICMHVIWLRQETQFAKEGDEATELNSFIVSQLRLQPTQDDSL